MQMVHLNSRADRWLSFRWRDGYDGGCIGWYWSERIAEPWADWDDEARRRLWPEEKSARTILAALRPGRNWRTVRPPARQLGLKSKIKRPEVVEILLEPDKETVPTDESEHRFITSWAAGVSENYPALGRPRKSMKKTANYGLDH